MDNGDGPVDTGTPKQRAVLAMLALQPGRTVSVQRLIDELWADEPPERAIASLQAYVSRLRRALEPGRSARDKSNVLVSRAPGYQLNVPVEAVDATRFAAAVEQARQGGDPHAALRVLDAALKLWRSDPLPELGDSSFARAERGRLHELRLTAVEERCEALLTLGREAEVVYLSEAELAEAPYRERVWGQLMLALYRGGRQADALAAYARARAGLVDELGIEPGPALQQLEQDILRQAPHLNGPVAPARAAPPPPRQPEPAHEPAPANDDDSGLVGRDAELRTVDRLLAEAAGGRGRLLLVSGSPGIGKSALLRELTARATGHVGTGTGVDGEAPPVFLPWAQILRGIAESGAKADLAVAFAPYGNLPAVLDPTLSETLPLPAAERLADPDLARSRLYQGIVDGLCRLAAAGSQHAPLVLVVDDAHWLDAPSTVLLTMFAKALRRSRVLLAVGYREAELAPDAPLAGALGELLTDASAVRLPLHGLDAQGVATLARAVTGEDVPAETVAMLVDRTGGNPFFVVELLRVLAAEHTLEPEHVPVRVQEVVRRRLAKLPGQVNAVVAVASVLGRDVSVPVLREVVQIDELALFDTLDTAVVSGVLTATDDPGLLRFSHDLVRQTAYLDQGPLRRARLHARAAQALRDTGLATAADLATHLRAALPVLSPYEVVPALADAAREAYDRTAHEQASAMLEEALGMVHRAPANEKRDAAELDLRIRLAYMHQATDGYLAPVVTAQYAAMEPLLLRLRGRPVLDVLPALWGYASFQTAAGNTARGVEVARSATAGGSGDPWAALVAEVHEGAAALSELDLVRANKCFETALAALPAGDLPVFTIVNWDPVIGALAPASIAANLLGDFDAADRHLRAARERAARVGEPFLDMYVANYAAVVAADRYDAAATLAEARATLATAERGGHREYQSLAGIVLGWAEVRSGDPSGLERIDAAREHLGDTILRFGRLQALHADACLALGRTGEAAAAAGAALERGLPGQSGFAEPDLRRIRALALGDRALAEEALCRARELQYAAAVARAEAALSSW
ncbi:BTAD domain-containing putative transcriptional regulator [Dactylosporangium sp. AC04546]|uniref:BTAD domain-containing putative transcriptional regulator n=1 Tax=Dactylosporangium sp. AC04546 TaxID=2862460 RepID=UPI001EE0EA9E|nr:BTAD domain-containing putative transcriptional regulator [Dactylosporangium sp. AC04546]WVK80165.1 BTAD domain-containing putative transcriptional regulator [Dactylosporangium sp. AC04546]